MRKVGFLMGLLLVVFCATANAATKPNFIVIFMDDLGYADTGSFGADKFATPHLDKMAAQGIRFTDFYAASSVCSPSRAALLTGRYPTRAGVPEVLGPDVGQYLGGKLARGLPQEELTVAEHLRAAGYATALIGKWHLGHRSGFLPTDQGFDVFFGLPYSNDMSIDPDARLSESIHLRNGVTIENIRAGKYDRKRTNPSGKPYVSPERYFTPLMEGDVVVEFPADQRSLTRRYTDRAIRFVEDNRDKSFFLYLAHTMPHVPLAPSSNYIGRSNGGAYGDTVEELDAEIGRLLAALDSLDLSSNTLVLFTSDNGPWNLPEGFGGSAGPLRGYKFQTHEGGQRVPMIARWPGHLPAGAEVSEVATTMDILPTFAALAEAPLPESLVIDGYDILPLLTATPGALSPYDAFFFVRGGQVQAVRRGQWKLQLANGGHEYRQAIEPDDPGRLYNLAEDIGESRDVLASNPDVAGELRRRIEVFQAQVDQDMERHK